MRTGPVAVEQRGAGDDRRLGGAVGVPHLAARRRRAARPSSGGQASPPKMSSRTWSSASSGHSAARVGTVDTTVMPLRDQPRAEVHAGAHQRARRGHQAGAVPPRQPHLLARRVERDRQPGQHAVAGPERLVDAGTARASASTNAAAERWVTATPLGTPVEPEVKMIQASSSTRRRTVGRRPVGVAAGDLDLRAVADHGRHAGLAEHQVGPLVAGRPRRPARRPRRRGAPPGSRRRGRWCRR